MSNSTEELKEPSLWKRCFNRRLQDHFTEEFSWKGLGWVHSRPSDFIDSQWQWFKPWAFTLYRVLLAIGMLCWIAIDIPRETHNYFANRAHVWFVYATNWSFGMFVIVLFLLAVYCLVYNCPRNENTSIILYGPLWMGYTLATNGIIVVCAVFWVALSNSNMGVFASFWGRLKHSLPAFLVIMDLSLSAIPFRLTHVIYPLLAGIIYVVFSVILWLAGVQGPIDVGQVYPGLNWSYPRAATLACLCVLFVSFLVHIFLYLIYFLRGQLSACMHGRGHALPKVAGIQPGYNEIDGKTQPPDDLISVTSMTSYLEGQPDPGRTEYGAVE